MGVEIIRIGNLRHMVGAQMAPEDLAQMTFQNYLVPNPAMAIWLMTLSRDHMLFPWWSHEFGMEEDAQDLRKSYNVTNSQELFDIIFLNRLTRFAGPNLYVIMPGSVKKTELWDDLTETDKSTFSRGQGCVYHLEGIYKDKMTINWVPFHKRQSVLKNPKFENLWRLYLTKRSDEDTANCLSFFCLSDPKLLPRVINVLIRKEEDRSERLSELVDWFGLYSSPNVPGYATSCAIYTKRKEMVAKLSQFELQMREAFNQAKNDMCAGPPRAQMALSVLSKNILM